MASIDTASTGQERYYPRFAATTAQPVPQRLHILLSTCPADKSDQLSRLLVETGRAACVNIVSGLKSVYQWQGQTYTDSEQLLVIKTAWPDLPELFDWLAAQHPYDVPEIISLAGDQVLPSYLQWAIEQSGTAKP